MNLLWDQEVPYIPLFGFHYFLYITAMLLLLLLMIRRRKFVRRKSETVRKWLLLIAVAQQILLYSWYIFETGFDISDALPLHISRISSLLGIVFLLTKKHSTMDLLFYFGLYAYGSFFYPSRVYPAYHALGMSFFINHALTILLPIFAALAYDWRPSFIGLIKSYGWFLLYFVFVYFLNPLIDGNYFYLKHRPFFGHWPDNLYVPVVLIFTFAIFLIGYGTARFLDRQVSHGIKRSSRRLK
ncbi:TIGR02206 family membrane protein [Atopococcus tabaci]|uniref:YwaF family protein n=1 Tax=Atopococcus tabaci TaxID=269774 RepID=UPI002409C9CB|nr:TIGR02206 family membrane protein [Atopococcus tabaci]